MRVCDCLEECCVSSKPFGGWVSRSGLMGVVENVKFGDLDASVVNGFFGDERLLFFLGVGFVHSLLLGY
jgi:hypothetical protein